jgi:hypothetical protein
MLRLWKAEPCCEDRYNREAAEGDPEWRELRRFDPFLEGDALLTMVLPHGRVVSRPDLKAHLSRKWGPSASELLVIVRPPSRFLPPPQTEFEP